MKKIYINAFFAVFAFFMGTILCSQAETSREIFEKGVSELKIGDPQKAIDLFTELIMTEPENAKFHKNRGVALLKLGKVDLAINDFQRALELNPILSGLHINLGAAWFYKNEYEKAILSYNQEIAKNSKSHIAYFNRALSRIKLNQQKLAMEDIGRCLELEPEFAGAVELSKTVKGFGIQTGAYLNRDNAVKMVEKLKGKNITPHILTLKGKRGKTWYLVRFEFFSDPDEARLFCENFIEQEKMPAAVRPWGEF
jgi:tetratricopeptide (TPR) repeat protein